MKKIIVVFAILFSICTVNLVQAQINTANIPHIIFARATVFTYTPFGADPVTVNVLDINGFNLFKIVPNTMPPATTIPVLKLGKVPLTVLKTAVITRPTGSELPNHQVIAQVPAGLLDGTYEIDFHNGERIHIDIIKDITIHANIPSEIHSKMVMMWSGTIGNIPSGWQLCDGTNSTPNLKNKFVVGAGNTYAVNATGGRQTIAGHRLTIAQIPSHNHPNSNASVSASISGGNPPGINRGSAPTGNTGGGGVHNHGDNRPPYHALPYICKN